MSLSYPGFELSLWRAEFKERSNELAFRRHTASTSINDLRLALWTWVILVLVITAYELQLQMLVAGEFWLLGTRSALLLSLLTLIFLSRRNPAIAMSAYTLTALEMLGFITLFLLLFSRPQAQVSIVMVIMMMLIAIFVVIPNRLLPATAAAAFGIAGTLYCAVLLDAGAATMGVLVLALFTPAAIGFLAARRLHLTQRWQFALLSAAENINEQLLAEIDRRTILEKELKHLAMTDPLTGLYNRRQFEFLFKRERQRAIRLHSKLSLCLVDLDYFKNVNDQHGHEIGDIVLQATAALFVKKMRLTDIIGRLGGEEFILLLPDTTIDEADVLINRLRLALAGEPVKAGELNVQVTATFAVAEVNLEIDNLAHALRAADKALYLG